MPVTPSSRPPGPPIWRPEQYEGQRCVSVATTQLDGVLPRRADRERVHREWIDFFSATRTRIRVLHLDSRVPRPIVDALRGQPQLRQLRLKWGPYDDLSPLLGMRGLRVLELDGASKLADLEPIGHLRRIRHLVVSGARNVDDHRPISALHRLRSLTLGDRYPGDDRNVRIDDLAWLEELRRLHVLRLPAARIPPAELERIARLPRLEGLHLPFARAYRSEVERLAPVSRPFAGVLKQWDAFDEWKRQSSASAQREKRASSRKDTPSPPS